MRLIPKLLLYSFTFTGLVQLVTASSSSITIPLKQSSNSDISKIDLLKNDTFLPPLGIVVKIGSPPQSPQTFNLLFDTGYSDTLVFSQDCTSSSGCPSVTQRYKVKSDSNNTSHYPYAFKPLVRKTNMVGSYYSDTFTQIGSKLCVMANQSFVAVSKISHSPLSIQKASVGSSVVLDGIFGAGPRDGTADHRINGFQVHDTPIMTFLNDNSLSNSFSLSFTNANGNGNVVFGAGAVDSTNSLGVATSSGSIDTWAIELTQFYYKGIPIALDGVNSIANISSGTAYTYLPNQVAIQLASSINPKLSTTTDKTTGVTKFSIDCGLKSSTQYVKMLIDKSFNVSLPVSNLIIGPDINKKCILSFVGTKGSSIIGYHFMKLFTMTFNYSNLQVEFSNA